MIFDKPPENFYKVFANEKENTAEFEELESGREYAREKMQVIIDSLYGDKPLNDMEDAVSEDCGSLDLPIPLKKELNVPKKPNEYFELGKYFMENQAEF